jgi:hypothetical protein
MTTLKYVSTEMNLHVPAYNLKRVMNIIGVESLIEAIKALLLTCLSPVVPGASQHGRQEWTDINLEEDRPGSFCLTGVRMAP